MCADGRCGHVTKPGEGIPAELLGLMNEMRDFLTDEVGLPEVVAKLIVVSTIRDAFDATRADEAGKEGLAA